MITIHLDFLIYLNKFFFLCLIKFTNPVYHNLIILIMILVIESKFLIYVFLPNCWKIDLSTN